MQKLKMQTPNMADENFKKLQELFPEAVTEVEENGQIVRAIDKDVLQQLISNEVVEGAKERYQFTWPGKHEAMLLAGTPTNKTLRPIKGENPIDDAWFDKTQNLYIEGDNLEILKIIQEQYLGKIKMIYIDPPYNTGNDFIYDDKFEVSKQEYLENNGEFDEEGYRLKKNLESNGRFHSDWLSMIYPRLKIARNLLSDDGVIFISIDDNEVENMKKLCNEVFSESNSVGEIIWQTATDNNPRQISVEHEYVLCYVKNINIQPKWLIESNKAQKINNEYKLLKTKGLSTEEIQKELKSWINEHEEELQGASHYSYVDDIGVYYPGNSSNTKPGGYMFDILHPITNKICKKPDYGYRWTEKTFYEAAKVGDVEWGKDETTIPKIKKRIETVTEGLKSYYYEDNRYWTKYLNNLFGRKVFENPKSVNLILRLLSFTSKKDSIILDFFSGSATTAHAVMQLNAEDGGNRKFIMVQLPEPCDEKSEAYKAGYKTICDIGKERIRRAGKKILEELKKMLPQNASGIAGGAGEQSETEGVLFDDDCKERPLSALRATSPKSFALGADQNSQLDVGFRVLRLDSSNMKDVFYRPRDLKKDDLLSFSNNIKEDRTDLDLLFQVMPECGADFSSTIDEFLISGKKVYKVGQNYIIACFDENINEEVIKEIAKQKPVYAIFRDSSFQSDSVLANFEQIFKAEYPEVDFEENVKII